MLLHNLNIANLSFYLCVEVDSGVEELIQKYLKEIEDLRYKYKPIVI